MSALTVRHSDELGQYLHEISRFALLTRDEERTLAKKYREEGDVQAAHKLVTANLRFVVRIASEYRGYGLRLLDLIQEGNVGLMQAVKRFDPDRGYRLITYAVWWIRAEIQSFILSSWSLVKVGAGRVKRKLFFKLRSLKSRAEQEAQGNVAKEDLAERLGVSPNDVTEIETRLAARDFSIDAPLNEESGTTFLDIQGTSAEQEEAIDELRAKQLLHRAVAKVLPKLKPKERVVLESRLLCDDPPSMEVLGQELGVSRQRVQQIEAQLVDRIRTAVTRLVQQARPRLSAVAP